MTDQHPPWADAGFRTTPAFPLGLELKTDRWEIDVLQEPDGWLIEMAWGDLLDVDAPWDQMKCATEPECFEACAWLAAVAREREGTER